jgi:hypothetical protein
MNGRTQQRFAPINLLTSPEFQTWLCIRPRPFLDGIARLRMHLV